jgi:hypothetical protein
MPKFTVPDKPGTCHIITGLTGLPTVTNGKGGKNDIYIPCPTREIAESICQRINEGDHNGQISIPYCGQAK